MECDKCISYYPGCSRADCIMSKITSITVSAKSEYYFGPKFERVSNSPDVILPVRATEFSAGYDFFCNEDVDLQPFQVKLVSTGIKIQLPKDKYLQLSLRSSIAIKRTIIMPNSPAIVDADYFNNEDNEGHIFVPILNLSSNIQKIEKHTRIAQGVILPYFKVTNDHALARRSGGFGSTGG